MAPCWRGPTVGLLLAALGPALAARSVLEQTPTKRYPVSGVVELLRNMKADVEKQADADEEVYDKLACWCTTNDKGKTKAISDGEARVSDLTSTIDRTAALTQTLTVEITSLDEELAKNQLSLEQATALRTKQHAEFIAEEKEMIQSIQALQAAIVVLAKHHGGGASLLSGEALAAAAVAAGRLQQHTSLLEGTLTPSQKRAVRALLTQQSPGGYFDAAPTFKQAYKPQSGEIFGILKEMKATFEADLAASQKEEIQNQQAYDQVKTAKESEIQAGQASSRDKQQQRADADERLAQSKQDREDTEASVSADKKFLTELKLKCAMTDKEWADRKQARQDELSAITEAIALLTSDDARDLFSRTYNKAAFIQRRGTRQASARERAATLLSVAARRTGSAGLLALAGKVKLDAFVRVKQAIDDMVAQLLQEKELEIQHKDWCVDELAKSERTSEKQTHTKATLESKIESLQLTVTGLNSTIGQLQTEIADLAVQKQRAKEDRDLEHQEFQTTLADQKSSRQLLEQALAMLSKIYGPQSFLQQSAQPTPPPGFGTLEKHGGGSGVLALITHIIEETKSMEAALLQDETDAQDAYTNFVQETTDSVAAKQTSVLDRTTEMTGKQQELVQAKSELDGTMTEMQALTESTAALHGSCDFVLKNFDLRQAARDEEVAALRQAKAYLSGMKDPAA